MNKKNFWLKGRKPGGKWYHNQCPLDTLIIWVGRIAVIALGFCIGPLVRTDDMVEARRNQPEPAEMGCTRTGWGGDC